MCKLLVLETSPPNTSHNFTNSIMNTEIDKDVNDANKKKNEKNNRQL